MTGLTVARRKADAEIDLGKPHALSVGLIAALRCPQGKEQAFLRDAETRGLRVRVTANGAKSFVFESKVKGKTLRRTIGSSEAWTIKDAQTEANRLRVLIDKKTDPRDIDREEAEEKARRDAQEAARALTVGEAWERYVAERKLHWGERTYADHLSMTNAGGEKRTRMDGLTLPGPLAPLMTLRLVDLDAKAVETWATAESKTRPARVRLALRMLKAFLRWAGAEPDLSDKANVLAANAKKAREAAGKAKPKDDVLQKEQLSAWFSRVRQIPNPIIAAYLQTLLLTGARPGEVLTLRWSDLNAQWKSITIRDKVEGERQIPLTPFVSTLLAALPRRNEWVFSSARAVSLDERHVARRKRYHAARGSKAPRGNEVQVSESGRLVEPSIAHRQACAAANLAGLTLHGLRRSFASLTEWLEVPTGVVAQIQGHKPSATAERHYKRRPLDLLRVHHERIEAWILTEAQIDFDSTAAAGLRVVS